MENSDIKQDSHTNDIRRDGNVDGIITIEAI